MLAAASRELETLLKRLKGRATEDMKVNVTDRMVIAEFEDFKNDLPNLASSWLTITSLSF
jgi:hypothetical protein